MKRGINFIEQKRKKTYKIKITNNENIISEIESGIIEIMTKEDEEMDTGIIKK